MAADSSSKAGSSGSGLAAPESPPPWRPDKSEFYFCQSTYLKHLPTFTKIQKSRTGRLQVISTTLNPTGY
ncbi:unnamed protein product [Schistosoma mattheei]|uniref:Uncharacterized protein n=1 Tax=Schistosoma mattheei TaxID=31246 RepID=A0A183NLS7_9TREM|nr:unnamed protein product [Schistosoma mattheei]